MAIASDRRITIQFTGDQQYALNFAAASNPASPAVQTVQDLSTGANTITVPTAIAPSGVTIVLPPGNVATAILKGVTGDTGIGLHPTDPTSIGLAAGVASFVITAGAGIADVRFIWT